MRAAKSHCKGLPTFAEIGARLGITAEQAQAAYDSGMRKLRTVTRTPYTLVLMHVLADHLDHARDERARKA